MTPLRIRLLAAGLLMLLIAGCSTLFPHRPEPGGLSYEDQNRKLEFTQPEGSAAASHFTGNLTNGTWEAHFGEQHDIAGTIAAFDNFKIYHIAAILLMVAGVGILLTNYVPNRWGVVSLVSGAGLGAFAHFVPSNGPLVSVLLIAGFVAAIVYLLWNYMPKKNEVE